MNVTPINVFISYAHESVEFRQSVKELSKWLSQNSNSMVSVSTDHNYPYRAPTEGWQVWMQNQIKDSEVVLVVCTQKYVDRFSKVEKPDIGRGAIFEGAIITTEMYNAQLKNDKFIPIIPDGGALIHVPTILQPFFNYLTFPTNNEDILKAILNENEDIDGIEPYTSIQKGEALILENQIVDDIIASADYKKEDSMFASIHYLVRAFLGLSDIEKLTIAKKLGVFEDSFAGILPNDRDRLIINRINEANLVERLWDLVNEIRPFNVDENPFKSI